MIPHNLITWTQRYTRLIIELNMLVFMTYALSKKFCNHNHKTTMFLMPSDKDIKKFVLFWLVFAPLV